VRCVRGGQIAPLNTSPVARDDSFSTSEDTAVSGNVITKPTADSDPENDPLHVSVWGTPSHGTLSNTDSEGNFTYTPSANRHGTDTFQYTLSDGSLEDNATVTITVIAVNDAPTAVNDTASTYEDTAVTIDVLANDSDIENDTLSLGSIQVPSHGSIQPSGNSIIYTPNTGYTGSDSFDYQVTDGNGGSANATVTITVSTMDDDGVNEASGVDGNHDGTDDRFQSHVATIPSGSTTVTIATQGETAPLTGISTTTGSIEATLSDGSKIILPYGTVSFTVTGLSAGGTATIALFFPHDETILGYAKQFGDGTWHDVGASVDQSNDAYTKLTFTITDGSEFDLDGTANGEVRDPGGAYRAAATASVTVPLSPFAIAVMALLFALVTLLFMRRRKTA
jgi:hypothetical protein